MFYHFFELESDNHYLINDILKNYTAGLGTEDGQEKLKGQEEGVTNTCIYQGIKDGSTRQITQTVTKLLQQSLKR